MTGHELVKDLTARAEDDPSAFTPWELDRLEEWSDGRFISDSMRDVLQAIWERLLED